MHTSATLTVPLRALGVAALIGALCGCGGEENPYKPQPAWSGRRASLPAPPSLPNTPIKTGDAYTVYGAIHQLRSLIHGKDVTANPISITGYIVDSNIPRAPDCSIHKTGKADPPDCQMEIPSFWIADDKGNTKGPKIRVVGWARNYAVIYDAIKSYAHVKAGEQPKEKAPGHIGEWIKDDILNVNVPFPIPAVGAKVKINGSYNVAKSVVSDMVSEPQGGVVAFKEMDTVEPAPTPANFAKPIK
jgi:hypothetical protein